MLDRGRHRRSRWPRARSSRGAPIETRYNTPRPPPPPPPGYGPRTSQLRARKKSERRRFASRGAVGTAAATVLIGGLALLLANGGTSAPPAATATITPSAEDPITTTLLYGTRERTREVAKQALWMTLMSFDSESNEASVIYIPAHTAVEVPGRGLQALGEVLGGGGVPLLLVGAENLLGVTIDRYVELSDSDARVLFDALGPVSVDVPAEVRVPAGKDRTRLIFEEGDQNLSSQFLVRLLYTLGVDGDDAELGGRHLAFWDALFETFHRDPENLGLAIRGGGPALAESDATPQEHAVFFEVLAGLDQGDLTITNLPVQQVSVGGSELYQTDREELASFVADTIGAAATTTDEVRVEILNGNGVPGIGQEAAQRLIGKGFRVILSGNASSLDHRRTLVVTYDSTPEGQALAERARDLLGVGEVQISGLSQGIVDLTIVIGKDFLRTL